MGSTSTRRPRRARGSTRCRLPRAAHRAGPGARARRASRSASSPAPPGSSATPSGSAARRCRAAASRWTPGATRSRRRPPRPRRPRGARDERSRATVGAIAVRPAIPTAVPGLCELTIDQRHPTPRARRDGQRGPRRRGPHRRRRAGRDRLRANLAIAPVAFDDAGRPREETVAAEVTGGSARLFSGALHDAAAVAARASRP